MNRLYGQNRLVALVTVILLTTCSSCSIKWGYSGSYDYPPDEWGALDDEGKRQAIRDYLSEGKALLVFKIENSGPVAGVAQVYRGDMPERSQHYDYQFATLVVTSEPAKQLVRRLYDLRDEGFHIVEITDNESVLRIYPGSVPGGAMDTGPRQIGEFSAAHEQPFTAVAGRILNLGTFTLSSAPAGSEEAYSRTCSAHSASNPFLPRLGNTVSHYTWECSREDSYEPVEVLHQVYPIIFETVGVDTLEERELN